MRIAFAALLILAPAAGHAERIFPSLPDSYRSGTVVLRLAAYGDRSGLGLSGAQEPGHGPDGFGNSSSAVTKTRSEMMHDIFSRDESSAVSEDGGGMSSPRDVGGMAVGPSGTIGGPV